MSKNRRSAILADLKNMQNLNGIRHTHIKMLHQIKAFVSWHKYNDFFPLSHYKQYKNRINTSSWPWAKYIYVHASYNKIVGFSMAIQNAVQESALPVCNLPLQVVLLPHIIPEGKIRSLKDVRRAIGLETISTL